MKITRTAKLNVYQRIKPINDDKMNNHFLCISILPALQLNFRIHEARHSSGNHFSPLMQALAKTFERDNIGEKNIFCNQVAFKV
jgi:hypothetical protein